MSSASPGLSFQDYEGCDYEQFWRGPGKEYLDKLERKIVSHALRGGDAVLDVGAGFGRLGSCYIDKYRSVHMLEPASNLRTAAARVYGSAVHYHDGTVYGLPFPNGFFDAVVMVRVFHHLGSPEVAIAELHRVLKPGGLLVFNYSNKRNLKRILLFLGGRASNPFELATEPYHSSLFGHHPKFVNGLLRQTGFCVRTEYSTGILDKVVEVLPLVAKIVPPSLVISQLTGAFRIAPAQFVVATKQ